MVEQVVKTQSLQQQEDTNSTRNVRGEVQTKTTFQRSAKGNITISECDPTGKFVTLENTHRSKVCFKYFVFYYNFLLLRMKMYLDVKSSVKLTVEKER